MKSTNIEKVKKVHLELLDEFIDVCNKYNLRYCLAYGTLLGAIREGGLLPWDYDVDVWMPFEDYKKLYELNKKEKLFSDNIYLSTYDGSYKYQMNHQLKMRGTTAMKEKAGRESHIFMDIYPLFNFVDDIRTQTTLMYIAKMFIDNRHYYKSMKRDDKGRNSIINLDELLLTMSIEEDIVYKDKLCSVDVHTMIGHKGSADNLTMERVRKYMRPLVDFNKCKKVNFRELRNEASVPTNFDEILRKLYGNYLIPVVDNSADVDWFLDAEHDCSYYRK